MLDIPFAIDDLLPSVGLVRGNGDDARGARIDSSAVALDQLAQTYRASGDYRASLDVYLELGRRFGLDGYHRELALSQILAGRADAATASIRLHLRDHSDDQFFWFQVASCFAAVGQFQDADRIFARNLEFRLPNEQIASTSSVRFLSSPSEVGLPNIPFLQARHVTFDPNGPALMAAAKIVHFVSCDASYLKRFLEPAVRSLQLYSGLRCGVHVHIIDPDEESLQLIEWLRRTCVVPIAFSSETIDRNLVPVTALKTYFSVARFLVLPDIVTRYRTTILMTDVDQLVVKSLSNLMARAEVDDVALLHFPTNVTNVLAVFSASVFVVCWTEGGRRFVAKVRDYLIERINGLAGDLTWHLDQAAVAYAQLTSPSVRWYPIPSEVLQSDVQMSEGHPAVRETALFWSITASISRNRDKEKHSIFRKFLIADNYHDNGRPQVLVADIDIHTVAGGGQALFRKLMANNPGVDFFYFSRGADLRLKEEGQLPSNITPLRLLAEDTVEPFYIEKSPLGLRQFYERLPLQMAASCMGRNFDAVDVPSYLPTAGLLRRAFELFGVTADRIVLSLHGWVSVGIRNAYEAAEMEVARAEFLKLEAEAIEAADALYTVSEHHKAELQDTFDRPITVIDMHGVLKSPTLKNSDGTLHAKPDLWFVGRLDRNKGPDLFVDIVSRLPRHLFGDCYAAGPDLPMLDGVRTCADVLREQANRHGIELHYEGTLSPIVLRERVFNGKTVLLVPSRSDTFNLAALEAVTSGTPILLSEAAGAATFLSTEHPEVPILTMHPNDIEAAVGKLSEFLTDYPQSVQRFHDAVRTMRWPPLVRDFMLPVYLMGSPDRPNGEEAQWPKVAGPYSKLRPDPRRRLAHAKWDMSDPQLTIIVPTYRRPEWLVNCLAALAQERPAHTRVIVIDDGSPPEMQIPATVARYVPFVSIISTENRGEANAVNLGISSAETPYVMILSDDDVIEGTWPARALAELESGAAILAYPNWSIIDEDGKVLEEHLLVDCTLDRLVGDHWCLPGPGSIFRRDAAMAVGGRNSSLRFVSDYDFWLRLSARGSFKHVPIMGAYWRYHGANGTLVKDQRLADEHVEIIAADVKRRRRAGAALPRATARRALSTAHLAAGVILSRGPSTMTRQLHFLRAFLLSPSTTARLPTNVAGYSHFYPRWLRKTLRYWAPGMPMSHRLANLYTDLATSFAGLRSNTGSAYGRDPEAIEG